MKKIGKSSISFDNVFVKSKAVVTGPKEFEGPIGKYFDYSFKDLYCNEDTWEKAEMRMMKLAFLKALEKESIKQDEIDYIVGGDLNNQIAITSYTFKNMFIPIFGVFAACSTFTESISLASILISSNLAKNVVAITSSHNATSERQFRYPTEYGGQKPTSMTSTATSSGAIVLTNDKTNIRISRITTGKIIDVGECDAQDMGRCMAPAAAVTLLDHLSDFNITVDEYDLILTGDLSKFGKEVFRKCLEVKEIDVSRNHDDAGVLLYDINKQDVFAGGSGCGCVTAVTLSYVLNQLETKKYKKVLVLATGALLNPVMTAQKMTVPCISHAVCFERV